MFVRMHAKYMCLCVFIYRTCDTFWSHLYWTGSCPNTLSPPEGSVLQACGQQEVYSDHVQQQQSQDIYALLIDVYLTLLSFTAKLDLGCDYSNMLLLMDSSSLKL